MKFLLIIPFLFSGFAFAKCEDEATTIDAQYKTLMATTNDEAEQNAGITHLLNAAFTPYLVTLNNLIREIPKAEIKTKSDQLAGQIEIKTRTPRILVVKGEYGFNGWFDGEFRSRIGGSHTHQLVGPFTNYNKELMRKLHLAVLTMATLEKQYSSPQLDSSINRSHVLRSARTYAGTDIWYQMFFSYLSVIQSAGALTANAVPNWTNEGALREVMRPGGDCLSPVVIHSLILPPRVLGQSGPDVYRKNPMIEENGRLVFSTDFKNFIRHEKKMSPSRPNPQPYEFGMGCPVAHKTEGMDQPGLQKFLDAVMYTFEVIE